MGEHLTKLFEANRDLFYVLLATISDQEKIFGLNTRPIVLCENDLMLQEHTEDKAGERNPQNQTFHHFEPGERE
jgi:hypothetical protein